MHHAASRLHCRFFSDSMFGLFSFLSFVLVHSWTDKSCWTLCTWVYNAYTHIQNYAIGKKWKFALSLASQFLRRFFFCDAEDIANIQWWCKFCLILLHVADARFLLGNQLHIIFIQVSTTHSLPLTRKLRSNRFVQFTLMTENMWKKRHLNFSGHSTFWFR